VPEMFTERSTFLFIFPGKLTDTLVAYHRYPIPPRSSNDLFGRPLFPGQSLTTFRRILSVNLCLIR
jgi:hypothetical protein